MSASSPDNEREEDVSSASGEELSAISRDVKHVSVLPDSCGGVWESQGEESFGN